VPWVAAARRARDTAVFGRWDGPIPPAGAADRDPALAPPPGDRPRRRNRRLETAARTYAYQDLGPDFSQPPEPAPRHATRSGPSIRFDLAVQRPRAAPSPPGAPREAAIVRREPL
jgi:hypothetical protein